MLYCIEGTNIRQLYKYKESQQQICAQNPQFIIDLNWMQICRMASFKANA